MNVGLSRGFYKNKKLESEKIILENVETGCIAAFGRLRSWEDEDVNFLNIEKASSSNIKLSNIADLKGFINETESLRAPQFYSIINKSKKEVNWDDIEYMKPYYIRFASKKTINYLSSNNPYMTAVSNESQLTKASEWIILPYIEKDQRIIPSIKCILIDDEIKDCHKSEDIKSCFNRIKQYCMDKDNIFSTPCASWLYDNKKIVDEDNDIQKFLIEVCEENSNRVECSCIRYQSRLKGKKLKANEYITYPHCLSKNCREYKYAFRLKGQDDNLCPSINCKQKTLSSISNDSSTTIQTCVQNISSFGSNVIPIGFIILLIVIFIAAYLYSRPKKTTRNKK